MTTNKPKTYQQSKKGPNRMGTITIATFLVVLLGLGIFAIIQSNADKEKDRVSLVYEGQPRMGDVNAPVKLMEFGDFKCPACKYFHDEVFPQLKKDFIDTGKVQLYFANYAFLGKDSMTAALLGEAIYKQNPELFWNYYDAVYANQKDEKIEWATPTFLFSLIKPFEQGLDVEQLHKDLDNKTYAKAVKADNDMVKKAKVDSAPSLFVNGLKVEKGLDYRELKKAIEEELKK